MRVIDEYVRSRATIDVHATELKTRTPGGESRATATFCDPAGTGANDVTGTSAVRELRSLGINVRYRRSGIAEGIESIRRAIRDGDRQKPPCHLASMPPPHRGPDLLSLPGFTSRRRRTAPQRRRLRPPHRRVTIFFHKRRAYKSRGTQGVLAFTTRGKVRKKNRTGSEGGEKARYPSPVVGKLLAKKRNSAQDASIGVEYAKGNFSPQLHYLFYHNLLKYARAKFQKNVIF